MLLFKTGLFITHGKMHKDTATKTGLDAAKTASKKKLVHKRAEATRELIGKKIAEKIVKPKPVPDVNSRNVEEIVFSSEKLQNEKP